MKFTELLNTAYRQSEISDKMVIFQYTISIDKKVNNILNSISVKKNTFYMNFPDNKLIYLGIGKIISHIISSKKELIELNQDRYKVISNRKNNLHFFGGIAFDLENESFYPWNNIPKGEFFIPKILIKENSKKTELTYTRYIDHSLLRSSIIKDYKQCCLSINKKNKTNDRIPNIRLNCEIPDKRKYFATIKKIIKKINNTTLEKAVISRLVKYDISSSISVNGLIRYLNSTYTNCFNFFICFNKNHTFIGSTPEKLISLNNRSFTIDAIAGSSTNKKDLFSNKEIDEHNHVTKHIYNTMKDISINLNQPKKPKILELKYINHLYTLISGTLKNKTHILNLLPNLYPTPALLGSSSNKAMKSIKHYEKTDRGWYGGAIGMYNQNGDGQFYVPIRSGLIKNSKLLLFTGSGIISKSNPQKEWNETVLKLTHILSYFNKR